MLTYKTSEDFEKMAKAGKVVSNIPVSYTHLRAHETG